MTEETLVEARSDTDVCLCLCLCLCAFLVFSRISCRFFLKWLLLSTRGFSRAGPRPSNSVSVGVGVGVGVCLCLCLCLFFSLLFLFFPLRFPPPPLSGGDAFPPPPFGWCCFSLHHSGAAVFSCFWVVLLFPSFWLMELLSPTHPSSAAAFPRLPFLGGAAFVSPPLSGPAFSCLAGGGACPPSPSSSPL